MAVFSTDLSQTVEVLLERKNYNSVKDILSTVNPADIAVIFRDQPAQRLLMLFRLLPKETAAANKIPIGIPIQANLTA